jgi:hypothetical protein
VGVTAKESEDHHTQLLAKQAWTQMHIIYSTMREREREREFGV